MQGINDVMIVFAVKNEEGLWDVQEPVTIGEIIDGDIEFQFTNGDCLPLNDIDWNNIDIRMSIISYREKRHPEGIE